MNASILTLQRFVKVLVRYPVKISRIPVLVGVSNRLGRTSLVLGLESLPGARNGMGISNTSAHFIQFDTGTLFQAVRDEEASSVSSASIDFMQSRFIGAPQSRRADKVLRLAPADFSPKVSENKDILCNSVLKNGLETGKQLVHSNVPDASPLLPGVNKR